MNMKQSIIATVVGGLILAIILAIVPELRNFLLDLISGVWTFLVSDQSYPLPGWALLLIGLFALLGLGIILMIILGS